MSKKMSTLKATLIAAIISHALVVLAVIFAWLGPAAGVGGNFCEAAREGLIKQPSNTISNIAFAIFGILAAYQLDKNKFSGNINAITQSNFFPKFLCILMVLLSPGSMAMHATETYMGGYFDMLSMYLIAALMFSYGLERFFHLSIWQFVAIFAVTIVICHIFHFRFNHIHFPLVGFSGNFIFGVFLVGAMIFEVLNHYMNKTDVEFKWALYAMLTFVVSFLIWLTGRNDHPWCHPYSYLQAHAIWHILDATALYFLFRFYTSENDRRFVKQNNKFD
jgi:hypothetical protein